MIEFPQRIWEPTGTKWIGDEEVTLWSSREVTLSDRKSRNFVSHKFEETRQNRLKTQREAKETDRAIGKRREG